MERKPRLFRITTLPISLRFLLRGQLDYFRAQGFDVFAVSSDGAEVREFGLEGIPHLLVPMTRKVTIVQDLKCIFILVRFIRRYKPDIVHTHTPKAGLVGMIAAWICRVPARLHTVAGLPLMESHGLARRIYTLVERVIAACATHVYPNSLGLANFIRDSIGVSPRKIHVIGRGSSNGIDTSLFTSTPALKQSAAEIRQRYGIGDGEIVFIFIGRLVKSKGVRELIAAFSKLNEERPQQSFRLFCLGYFEPDLDPLDESSKHFLYHDSRVVLAGFQPDVRPWLLASDILVFPSYREGFPNVVMQACCLEVPCVVSDINGCNEIIDHGRTGLVVAPKAVTELAAAMGRMVDSPEERRLFASRSRRYVAQHFSQQHVWEALYNEYRKQLSMKGFIIANAEKMSNP